MLGLLYRFTTPWAKANCIQIFINRIMGRIANIIYPWWCSVVPENNRRAIDNSVVVSLTSYPARIDKVHLCVDSLLRQTIKPMHLILWLSKEQFPNGIPKKLSRLEKKGLEIRYCKDYRSYKKIFETMQLYPDYNIVIADDDTYYPPFWLQKLLQTSREYNDCVVCYRAAKIVLDSNNIPIDGKYWDLLSKDFKGPSYLLSATGVGGVLYPKDIFANEKIDKEKIIEMAPTSDDYWLKVYSLYKGYEVVKVESNSTEWFTIKGSQKNSLTSINAGNQKCVMDRLLNYYEFEFTTLHKEDE